MRSESDPSIQPGLSELIRQARREFYELSRQGLPGLEEARVFSSRISSIIGSFFLPMKLNCPWAIIGVGGLGRGELSFLSDIDILFLYRGRLEKTYQRFIQKFTYSLWDIGVEVGHNVLPLSGALILAKENFSVLTSHITSKLIAGDLLLYNDWQSRLRKLVGKKGKSFFLEELKRYIRSRFDRYGDSSYLLEPHIKEGIGGLRDVHIVRWICWAMTGSTDYESLPDSILSRDEKLWLIEAENFLWQVRLQLHALSGRRQDQIYFADLEKLVSSALGEFIGAYSSLEHRRQPLHNLERKDIKEMVEAFMRNYYQHTSRIRRTSTFFFERFKMMATEKSLSDWKLQLYVPKGEPIGDGTFLLEGHHIRFANPSQIASNPIIIMRLFHEAASRGCHFHHRTGQIIRGHLSIINDDVRQDPEASRLFFEILLNPKNAFNVLKMMVETGFLQTFIPEFQHVRYRVQYDVYHLYTVDEHLLRTVRELHLIETDPDPSVERMGAPELIRELTPYQKRCLFLASLIHDIGKGHGKNHAEHGARLSEHICQRLGMTGEETELIVFLVKNHLILAETALKRDLSDEKPIVKCGAIIENPTRLDMLYLLTIADSRATGPSAWNTWRTSLLRELYGKIRRILTGRDWQRDVGERIKNIQEKCLEALLEKDDSEKHIPKIVTWLETLSHRYLLSQSPKDIIEHYFMEQELSNENRLVVKTYQEEKDIWQVTVATYDRPGLFAIITGVLWCCGVNILSADIFTRSSGIALDVLRINEIPDPLNPDRLWNRFKEDMKKSLEDRSYLDNLIKNRVATYHIRKTIPPVRPDRVIIDEESSDFYTILEVYTWDRPGVLYAISDELFKLDLSIQLAKITTPGAQVADIFYVNTLEGSKILNPERHEEVKKRILERLKTVE
ncbi:MAG: [protein-PII] uridylyltransferase [Syntrophobacterales bacterium]|nr:[protein-PII] uridylyltransferase [Syntrophobacterales bacterium]